MKVIISGGGTGGHIYPALAVADALKKYDSAIDLLFVGAKGKMEMQHVPAAGYPIVGITSMGLQRRRLLANAPLPLRLLQGLWQARRLLKQFRPDVVLGTGGYASAPIVYMAAQRHIPTLIQEQNAVVGLTNRFLGRYVDKICVAYEGLARSLPQEKLVLTGNPVRHSIVAQPSDAATARAHFGLRPDKKCLLVLGGSLGAQTINDSVLQALDQWGAAEAQILWATGRHYYGRIQAQLTSAQQAWVKVHPFVERIDLAYAAADAVISRAGAIAIAELALAQKPTILVPSPNVTADHQTHNAMPLVRAQAAQLIEDKAATEHLSAAALQLLHDEAQQRLLAQNIQAWARPQAADAIVAQVLRLATRQ